MKKNMSKLMAVVLAMILCVSLLSVAVSAETVKESLLPDGKLVLGSTSGTGAWEHSNDPTNAITFTGTDTASAWGFAFVQGATFDEFTMTFKINKWTDGGVLLGASSGEAGLNAYMVGTDGVNMYFAKYVNGKFGLMNAAEYKVEGGAAFASPYTKLSDATWTITVADKVLSVYVDGAETPLIQVQDSAYTAGSIGFQHKTAVDKGLSLSLSDVEIFTMKEVETPTEPEATEPEATEPEATEPEATEPEATEPEATEPEATEPEATEPEATKPADPYYLGESLLSAEELANLDITGTGDFTLNGNDITFGGGTAGGKWGYGFIKEKSFGDFVLRMHLDKWTDGGVIFRASSSGSGLNGYMVGTDGVNIYLAKYVNGKFGLMSGADYAVEGGAPFASPYTQTSDATWTITVVGDVISVYIDDATKPLIQARDSEYTTGGIGFQLKTAADMGEAVRISNVGVYTYLEEAPKTGVAPSVKPVVAFVVAGLMLGAVTYGGLRKKKEQ